MSTDNKLLLVDLTNPDLRLDGHLDTPRGTIHLQRKRFLPAIALIKSRLDVINVDGGQDYRRLKLEKLKVYHVGQIGRAHV